VTAGGSGTDAWLWWPRRAVRRETRAEVICRRFKAGRSLASLFRQYGRHVVERAIRRAL